MTREQRQAIVAHAEAEKPNEACGYLTAKDGVDTIAAGTHALYFRRLIAKAAQSFLTRITGKAVYQDLTIRNWNTSVALAKLVAP